MYKLLSYKLLALTLVGVSLTLSTAAAREIYCNSGSQLLRFDSATPGSLTVIGDSGAPMFGGMDFSSNMVLYGYTEVSNGSLYTVDITTGHATLVGGGGTINNDVMTDLAWDPVAGIMYGIGAITPQDPTHLYTINLSTGYATLVGAINVPKPSMNFGLAVSPAGVMYMEDGAVNGMYRLDGLNATFMGNEGFDFDLFDGFTIDWEHGGTWYHGAWNMTTQQSELWTVDPDTGVGTFIGRMGASPVFLGDLAIVPAPEPATLGLLVAGALLLWRRRN